MSHLEPSLLTPYDFETKRGAYVWQSDLAYPANGKLSFSQAIFIIRRYLPMLEVLIHSLRGVAIGVDLDFSVLGHNMIVACANGTAVKVEPLD